ncbi:MAG: endo-1,4-beta-xylanase [Phycisphaerales bacterium]
MLLFAAFENDQSAQDWPLRHARVLGPEEVVIPGEVTFDRGLIRCERRTEGAGALMLQFPIEHEEGGRSLLTLRTCLLPQRATPYLLSLELARHRLMLLLNKLEEWAFFDLPADDPITVLVERTRQAFTAALLAQRIGKEPSPAAGWYTPEADAAARRALALGIAAGEALAKRQAEKQHTRRVSGELARAAALVPPENAITDHEARASREAWLGSPGMLLPEMPVVGCAINPLAQTAELQAVVAAACDFVTLPMRWVDMEPTEGKYAFARTDKWIEWAVRTAKLPVHAGPLIDLRPGCVPDFLYIWEHDYETLRDVVAEHVKNLVTRTRRAVNIWTVASGLPCSSVFRLGYEQVLDLTRVCVTLVRKLAPASKVVVEIAQPWGEYTGGNVPGTNVRSIPPVLYGELMNQLGLPIDALGVRIQMGQALPGRSARDLLTVSHLLDRLAALDRPLAITALGAPSRAVSPAASGDDDSGEIRRPWSPESQAEWLASVAAMAAGKPFVQSICYQDLYDADISQSGEMPGGALVGGPPTWAPKPAAKALAALRTALRERRPTLG